MDKWELLVVVVIIIAVIYISSQIMPIFAQEISRDHIRNLKNDINEAKQNYGRTDNQIVSQRLKIEQFQIDYNSKKLTLDEYENTLTTSWTAVGNITEARIDVDLAKIRLDDAKVMLLNLQSEKEKWLAERTKLESQLETDNIIYIDTHQPDLSNLTKLIGVRLSQNCILMIKENIESGCPTYEEVVQLDSSNTQISGEFSFYDGYFHRERSQYKNEYAWYQHDDKLRVIVDPSVEHMDRIKMITIENNFNIYLDFPDFKVVNNTVTHHKDRSIENNCRDAQISAMKWMELIGDTIHYLRTDCTITKYDNTIVIERDDTPWNPEDSPGWQYRQWLALAKQLCLGLC